MSGESKGSREGNCDMMGKGSGKKATSGAAGKGSFMCLPGPGRGERVIPGWGRQSIRRVRCDLRRGGQRQHGGGEAGSEERGRGK